MVKQHDRDGDKRISRHEFPGPKEVFDIIDTDKDNFITKEEADKAPPPRRAIGDTPRRRPPGEFRSGDESSRGRGPGMRDENQGPGNRMPPEFTGERKGGRSVLPDGFLKADKDGDSRVSRKEFKGPDWAFEALDKNSDGYITPGELMGPRMAVPFNRQQDPGR